MRCIMSAKQCGGESFKRDVSKSQKLGAAFFKFFPKFVNQSLCNYKLTLKFRAKIIFGPTKWTGPQLRMPTDLYNFITFSLRRDWSIFKHDVFKQDVYLCQ